MFFHVIPFIYFFFEKKSTQLDSHVKTSRSFSLLLAGISDRGGWAEKKEIPDQEFFSFFVIIINFFYSCCFFSCVCVCV